MFEVLRRTGPIIFECSGGSGTLNGLVDDIQMRVVDERLQVRARKALRKIGVVAPVDCIRYSQLPTDNFENLIESLTLRRNGMNNETITSLRSSLFGISHRIALSRRPGRSRAESIRSGRLDNMFVSDGTVTVEWWRYLVAART